MTTLKLDGTLYHKGIAGDPIVLLSVFDEGPLEDWCKANQIFTQIMKHKDPKSGNDRMAIYVTEGAISGLKDGEQVSITVDVRPDKRGNGIGVVSVNRLTN